MNGCAISFRKNLELYLGCHTCRLSYFTLVCLWCGGTGGWMDGHTVTRLQVTMKISQMHTAVDNQIFLPMVLCCTHKSSAIIIVLCELEIFAGLNGTSESLQVR